MSRKKLNVAVLGVFSLTVLLFQNCTNKISFGLMQPESTRASNGNGPGGYDGKSYVNYGSCPNGTIGIKGALSLYFDKKGKVQNAAVRRENCADVTPERQISLSGVHQSLNNLVVTYNNAIYDNVPADLLQQRFTTLYCRSDIPLADTSVWLNVTNISISYGSYFEAGGATTGDRTLLAPSIKANSIEYSSTDGVSYNLTAANSGLSNLAYKLISGVTGNNPNLICINQPKPSAFKIYSWKASGFGACNATQPAWQTGLWTTCSASPPDFNYSAWSACSAPCGGGTQTRSEICNINTGTQTRSVFCPVSSGIQSQTVECRSDDGQLAASAYCDPFSQPVSTQTCTRNDCGGSTPAAAQSCSQGGGNSCANPQPTSQACNTQACWVPPTYSWNVGGWGACSAPQPGWSVSDWGACSAFTSVSYTPWSSCSNTCGDGTQYRQEICTPNQGVQYRSLSCPTSSGVETRTVQCVSSQGAVVNDSYCAGPKPSEQQSCSRTDCDTNYAPATSQACSSDPGAGCTGGTQSQGCTDMSACQPPDGSALEQAGRGQNVLGGTTWAPSGTSPYMVLRSCDFAVPCTVGDACQFGGAGALEGTQAVLPSGGSYVVYTCQ